MPRLAQSCGCLRPVEKLLRCRLAFLKTGAGKVLDQRLDWLRPRHFRGEEGQESHRDYHRRAHWSLASLACGLTYFSRADWATTGSRQLNNRVQNVGVIDQVECRTGHPGPAVTAP